MLIDRGRMVNCFVAGLLGDLVEQYPMNLAGDALTEMLCDMPRDRLAFAIGVGSEIDVVLVLRRLFEALDHLGLGRNNLILRLEALFDIDTKSALGQIDDMPNGRCDRKVAAEVTLD